MSAYQGWLLKINGQKFPMDYIAHASYNATPDQLQDEDSYQDADGLLHRNVLPHARTKIEWTTPFLHLEDKIRMQSYFPDTVTVEAEYWNDKRNGYATGIFYVPDIQFPYYDASEMDIRYNPIRIALIEY